MEGEEMSTGDLKERARQWIIEHRQEPLKCVHCQQPQMLGPAGTWAFQCTHPDSKGCHSYAWTITNDSIEQLEEQEAECFAAFAERETEQLRSELASTQSLLTRYKKALEYLTPGGSEFVNDPERCAAWAKNALHTEHEQLLKKAKSLAAAERELAALKAVHPEFATPLEYYGTIGGKFIIREADGDDAGPLATAEREQDARLIVNRASQAIHAPAQQTPKTTLTLERIAMNAWQVLGALWGIHVNPEQERICNYFWAVAHGEKIPELFPLKLAELDASLKADGWVRVQDATTLEEKR